MSKRKFRNEIINKIICYVMFHVWLKLINKSCMIYFYFPLVLDESLVSTNSSLFLESVSNIFSLTHLLFGHRLNLLQKIH